MAIITVESEETPWHVDGARRTTENGAIMLARGELVEIRVADLLEGFREYQSLYGGAIEEDDLGAVVFQGDDAYLDTDEGYEQVSFSRYEGRICVRVEYFAPWPENDDQIPDVAATVRRTIEPLLSSYGAELVDVAVDAYGWKSPLNYVALDITISPPNDWINLQQLYDLGESVDRLITAFLDPAPTRETMADLIRGGHARLLVGQNEGNWLDVKSAEYVLNTDKGKFSLAIEAAAFCNSEEGGVLVFGAATDTPIAGGGEIIVSVGGLDQVRTPPRQYMKILNNWVYPYPLGLRVDAIELPNGNWVLMVDIPAQPEEIKPFLVSAAQNLESDSKIDRESITVPQRRGEDTVRLTASMLQAQLAVGRAFLRGSAPQDR